MNFLVAALCVLSVKAAKDHVRDTWKDTLVRDTWKVGSIVMVYSTVQKHDVKLDFSKWHKCVVSKVSGDNEMLTVQYREGDEIVEGTYPRHTNRFMSTSEYQKALRKRKVDNFLFSIPEEREIVAKRVRFAKQPATPIPKPTQCHDAEPMTWKGINVGMKCFIWSKTNHKWLVATIVDKQRRGKVMLTLKYKVGEGTWRQNTVPLDCKILKFPASVWEGMTCFFWSKPNHKWLVATIVDEQRRGKVLLTLQYKVGARTFQTTVPLDSKFLEFPARQRQKCKKDRLEKRA